MTTTAASRPSAYRVRWPAGMRLGTTRSLAGNRRRANAYWVSPIAMPTAAAAKPTLNPHVTWSHPVSSGPMSAPRLMPR